jgi:hypothetical protein
VVFDLHGHIFGDAQGIANGVITCRCGMWSRH